MIFAKKKQLKLFMYSGVVGLSHCTKAKATSHGTEGLEEWRQNACGCD